MKKIILSEAEVANHPNDMELGTYVRKKINHLESDNVIFVRRKFFLAEKTNENPNNQILFSNDGKAWISDGHNSFRVFYNPFNGEQLKLSTCEDFEYLPGFLVGKKISSVRVEKNKILFLIDQGDFALLPSCKDNSFISSIEIGQLDTIVDKVILNIDYHIDYIYQMDNVQGILKLNIKTLGADYKFDWIVENSVNCSLILEKLD